MREGFLSQWHLERGIRSLKVKASRGGDRTSRAEDFQGGNQDHKDKGHHEGGIKSLRARGTSKRETELQE